MKVAILCSGLITEDMDISENIKTWRTVFPNAHLYMGTWDRPDQRNNDTNFTVYYPESRPHYHCGKPLIEHTMRRLRAAKAKGKPYSKLDLADITSIARHKKFHNVKQFLAHIYMFKDFVQNRDYDLVLRVRPDTHIDLNYIDAFKTLMNMVIELGKPIGFETIDAKYEKHDHGWNKFVTEGTQTLSDWAIAYVPKTFDPDIAIKAYEDKKIRFGEAGWYDVLIRNQACPQEPFGTCWNGIVSLRNTPDSEYEIIFQNPEEDIVL